MEFIVMAYDATDEEALKRRLDIRPAHMAQGEKMLAEGKYRFGAALLNDEEKIIGSMIVADFASRDELNAWLEIEPYVTGHVWEKIEVTPCRIGPRFGGRL
ncbi:hypothetical protein KDH_07620 [Dictyobacter sp. S3.2.2.5]|uniref:YCII-related domain-containing protein n=1 Tax=Dictyobacter halimunensis TaxID=3026934 RepID=A0ABQ6FK16_9CHLR|nr:hypothetical protein KDH_07620 [Dictyobacter sp. S3.2.2.5]